MRIAIAAALMLTMGCRPKTTDSGTITDLNPCEEGQILASNGECVSGASGDDTGG